MKQLIKWLKSLFTKESAKIAPTTKPKQSALVKRSKMPKKVSEMSDYDKKFHFFEQRVLWLSKHGYESKVHLGKNPKPEKPLSHYRVMLNRIHKMRADGQVLKNAVITKVNKYGIKVQRYPDL